MARETKKSAEEDYRKALDSARGELADLLLQKDEIEKRVAQLRQTVVGLSALSEGHEDLENVIIEGRAIASEFSDGASDIGFTDVCREVLKAADADMSPTEVRDGILRMGLDLNATYTNPLAVIHTTLKRLCDNGEVAKRTDKGGKIVYRWKRRLVPVF